MRTPRERELERTRRTSSLFLHNVALLTDVDAVQEFPDILVLDVAFL